MKRTSKIAPRLTEIVDDLDGHPDFLKSDHATCLRELRALTTLFRKSAHLAELIESAIRNGDQVCGSEVSFVRAFKNVQRDLAAARSPGSDAARRTR